VFVRFADPPLVAVRSGAVSYSRGPRRPFSWTSFGGSSESSAVTDVWACVDRVPVVGDCRYVSVPCGLDEQGAAVVPVVVLLPSQGQFGLFVFTFPFRPVERHGLAVRADWIFVAGYGVGGSPAMEDPLACP
jgi:hypothetical protein